MTRRRLLDLAVSLYRALLVFYPRAFRRRFGQGMVQLFKDRLLDEAAHRGWRDVTAFGMGSLQDVLVNGLGERWKALCSGRSLEERS